MLIAEGFCTTSGAGRGGRAGGFLTRPLKPTLGQQLSPSLLKTEPKPAKPLWKARTPHELEEQDLRNRIYFQVRESGAGRCQRQDGTFPLPGTAMGSFPPLESPQDLSLLVLPWDISHRGTAVGSLSLQYHCGTFPPAASKGFSPPLIQLWDISLASTTTGPFPPWLLPQQRSDDAGRSEDRGDTKCLCHLPAAGQRGAEALTVVFCLGWLSLEELDGFPASGDTRGGARGKSSSLGMGREQFMALVSPRNNSQR